MIEAVLVAGMAEQLSGLRRWLQTMLPLHGRGEIVVSLLASMCSTFAMIGLSFVLLDLRETVGITNSQVNLLRCTAFASGLLIVFCASSLCRRFGAKRCLAASLVLWIAGCVLLAVHSGLALLVMGLVLMGCADGCVRVSAFAMLYRGATNGQQVAALVTAYTLISSLASLSSPFLNSWLLVNIDQGVELVVGLWSVLFTLVLLALLRVVRSDGLAVDSQVAALRAADWLVLLTAGACAALVSTLPIIYAFQPGWLLWGVALCLALLGFTARALRRSPAIAAGFVFLANPRLTLQLLALASLQLIDYRYCAERFLVIRYELNLAVVSAWMIPTSLASVAAAFAVAFVLARVGLSRTMAIGVAGALVLPLVFITAPAQVPVPVIAAAAASFGFFVTFVRIGLSTLVTSQTDRAVLANLEAVRHVLATASWSLGSALSVQVLVGGFRRSLEQQLQALPLSPAAISTISRRVASGEGRQALIGPYGVSKQQLLDTVGRGSADTIQSIMAVLHGMGWLIALMLLLSTLLIVLSRRAAVPVLRSGLQAVQLK